MKGAGICPNKLQAKLFTEFAVALSLCGADERMTPVMIGNTAEKNNPVETYINVKGISVFIYGRAIVAMLHMICSTSKANLALTVSYPPTNVQTVPPGTYQK